VGSNYSSIIFKRKLYSFKIVNEVIDINGVPTETYGFVDIEIIAN
jgi:hypothetical protein